MSVAIFLDSETTGFIKPCRDSDDSQPHAVQLAASMVDLDRRKILSSIDLIIKPEGWDIEQEAMETHGISTEMAMDLGVSEKVAIEVLVDFITDADNEFRLLIGHNIHFDARILRIAMKRYGMRELALTQKEAETYCTMNNSTKIVQCPPTEKMEAAGRNHSKSPNLGEAYKFFTGKDLSGAHNAMVDVKACMHVYFGIIDYEKTS